MGAKASSVAASRGLLEGLSHCWLEDLTPLRGHRYNISLLLTLSLSHVKVSGKGEWVRLLSKMGVGEMILSLACAVDWPCDLGPADSYPLSLSFPICKMGV